MNNTAQAVAEHEELCEETMKTFADGPWKAEPHRVEFVHAGLECLLSRNPFMGNWCGYVGVPPAHPLHGKPYRDCEGLGHVHGGLTYSEPCHGYICHLADNEGEKLHWLGFDCAHGGDLIPRMLQMKELADVKELTELTMKVFGRAAGYKDVQYVRRETEKLAEALAAVF